VAKITELTVDAIDQTILQHLEELRKPGVLTVRSGFEVANHRLSGESHFNSVGRAFGLRSF
jgi:hypothetical protein